MAHLPNSRPDSSRYLRREPVSAGPATTGYRIRKYAARHRIGLATVASVLLLMIGFVLTQAVQLRRIRLERDKATRERERANRITDFMTSMFKVSDPSESRGNTITAREVLDKASSDISSGLASDAELQAQMMFVMSQVYDNLGLYSRSESLATRAADIRFHALGASNP